MPHRPSTRFSLFDAGKVNVDTRHSVMVPQNRQPKSRNSSRRMGAALLALCGLMLGSPATAQVRRVSADDSMSVADASAAAAAIRPEDSVYPLSLAGPVSRHRVMVGDSPAAASTTESAGAAGTLVYSNTLGTYTVSTLTAGARIADDIVTTAASDCPLDRYAVRVSGDADGSGAGLATPYTANLALYKSCPGASSSPNTLQVIAGTQASVPLPDGGVYDVEVVIPFLSVIELPSSFFVGVWFDRTNAGVVVGAPATIGFSKDRFDFPGYPCGGGLGGFPEGPHASFHVEVYVRDGCPAAFPGYHASHQSGPAFTEGPRDPLLPGFNRFGDDIQLPVPDCRMVAYEVSIKGRTATGSGALEFDLKSVLDDADPETGGRIEGTRKQIFVFGNEVVVAHYAFDPPIPLPSNIWMTAITSSDVAGVIVTGREASLGQSDREYVRYNTTTQAWELATLPNDWYGAFDVTIFCEGQPPLGACCDVLYPDEAGESVCRDVPEMNCAFPTLWREGESCSSTCIGGANDTQPCTRQADCPGGDCPGPFPAPCGVAACCTFDDQCLDLTENECNALEPVDDPRLYQPGRLCGDPDQVCPRGPCLDRDGLCGIGKEAVCLIGEHAGEVCDPFLPHCTGVCFDNGLTPCNNDLACPGSVCARKVCDGGSRNGQACKLDSHCPDGGTCSRPNCEGEPGCEDPFCCTAVCNQDQFCCLTHWDDFCAQRALTLEECIGTTDCNGNGVPDVLDIVNETSEDCNQNGIPDECEGDVDGDGAIDACDGCPFDPLKLEPGGCGCGVADDDRDLDGTPNCIDRCPDDPNKIERGVCGCGVADDSPECIGACCTIDEQCLNVTEAQCNAIEPVDAPRLWQPGLYCLDPDKICPRGLCLGRTGSCTAAKEAFCLIGENAGEVCDPFLPHCAGVCYPEGTVSCTNDLQCPSGNVCAREACDGGSRDGQACDLDSHCPDGGTCSRPNCEGEPGCEDPFCCTAVCNVDSFCCLVHWDATCAARTAELGECADCNGNGIPDADDILNETSDDCDQNGVPDECEEDADGDGTIDACDGCPLDPLKLEPGVCGCGVTDDDDRDLDGTPDCLDGCPYDPNKTDPGVCGCGISDDDTDGDGVPDCSALPDTPYFQMRIVQVNDTVHDPYLTAVSVGPGDLVYVEVFAAEWSPNGEALRAWQVALDGATLESGIRGVVAPRQGKRPCTDAFDCLDLGRACGIDGTCGGLETSYEAGFIVDKLRPDWIYAGRGDIVAIDSSLPALRFASTILSSSDSPTYGPPGDITQPVYAGTMVFEVGDMVCGDFEINLLPSPDSKMSANQPDLPTIEPLQVFGVTIGTVPFDSCACPLDDCDCDDNGILDWCDLDCGPAGGSCDVVGCGQSTDADYDGILDQCDGCPDDPNKFEPGQCGCGVADSDNDSDGVANCHDGCPSDPNKSEPGFCGCGIAEDDRDGDGTPDCSDDCPFDTAKTAPGQCGCGVADTDADGDTVADCRDNCPNDANPDQSDENGNGIGDACDTLGIPAVSAWGVLVLVLLVLTLAKIGLSRSREVDRAGV